jgi:hypothetical protein
MAEEKAGTIEYTGIVGCRGVAGLHVQNPSLIATDNHRVQSIRALAIEVVPPVLEWCVLQRDERSINESYAIAEENVGCCAHPLLHGVLLLPGWPMNEVILDALKSYHDTPEIVASGPFHDTGVDGSYILSVFIAQSVKKDC